MILLSKYYTEETKPFNLYLLKKREERSPPFNSVILFLFPVLILMKEEIDRTDPNGVI